MDWRDLLIGQLGVLFRALVMAAVGYGAWVFVSGSSFEPVLYGKIVAGLFVATNAVFWFVKLYRPDVLEIARVAEDRL